MDFPDFLDRHLPTLERDAVGNNMILGLLARHGTAPPPELSYWSLGAPGCCAIHYAGNHLIVTDLDEEACLALAGLTRALPFRGVAGPAETTSCLVEIMRRDGLVFGDPELQGILALAGPPHFPEAAGHCRPVAATDGPLYAEWMLAFARDVVPHDPVPDRAELQSSAARSQAFFWIDGDQPVSVARVQRLTQGMGAISRVYTPPEHRGKGYAGSVTAAVSQHILALGRPAVCLYVDQANPASNRCYAKIGFTPVRDCRFYPRQMA